MGAPYGALHLSQSLADLGFEVSILEGDVGAAKVGVLQGSLGRLGHCIPVRDRVGLSHSVGELQLVVGGESGEVFDLRAVALHLWDSAGGLGVTAVAGCCRADDLGGCCVRVVDLDHDVLEVVCGTELVVRFPGKGVRYCKEQSLKITYGDGPQQCHRQQAGPLACTFESL